MKKIIIIAITGIFLSLSLYAQETTSKVFYYYQGETIFLHPRADKVFLKFTHNVKKEQVQALINENASVRLTSGRSLDDDFYNTVVLEVKENSRVSSVIESYKTRDEIISATPILQYNDALQGLTDEFVVKLNETTSYEQLQELAEKNHCKVGRGNEFVKNQFMVYVAKTSNLDALQMSNLFYETGLFDFSEPNFIMLNAFQSNDTYFNQQWSLKNIGQNEGTSGVDVKVEQAWNITQGNPIIKVAVIDQGVDLTHPDLQVNLLPGFDASGNNSDGAPVWIGENHGTACAGIIGAVKDNGAGISGVSPNCRIIPIHASNNGGGLPNDWAANSIQWAWQNGADVISNSWGGGSNSAAIDNAINAAVTQGRGGKDCIVVFSTGNYNTTVAYPATLPNVIAVGAINRNGDKADFSNYGVALDIVAPGVDIPTTDRQGNSGYNYTTTNPYYPAYSDYTNKDYTGKFNGTSAACPHVSGVAALMLSANPNLTQKQVRDIIESTAQKVRTDIYSYSSNSSHPKGTWNNQVGYGLVDAYKAVLEAQIADCPTQVVNFTNQNVNTTNTTVTNCAHINVQNVTVTNNKKLTIDALGTTTINGNFEVQLGSELEIK